LTFRIRRASVADLPLLAQHRSAMFEEYGPMTPEEREVASEAYPGWARRMIKKGLFHGYIVHDGGGNVAASGCVWLRETQPSRGVGASLIPYLMSVYTVPAFRRNGLASLVVTEAMEWAKSRGYPRMTLHASPIGRRVYARLGWKRTWEMEVDLEDSKDARRPKTSQPSKRRRQGRRAPTR
jgi:GNAT superfamily N-acetyltransferase